MIPEEVRLTHAPSGVQLGGSQRLVDAALASWRSGPAAATSASLTTSGLSLSTRSSDVDLKEFLVHRGSELATTSLVTINFGVLL